jgi:hypothetical protein
MKVFLSYNEGMKIFLFSFLILFSSSPAFAESEYTRSLKTLFTKMIEAKKEKDQIIRSSKSMPEAQRAATIRKSLADYAEKMAPLLLEQDKIEERFAGFISASDRAYALEARTKVSKFIHDESAMEQAAKEINMTADLKD